MILTKLNYRTRSSNYKWKVGYAIFPKEASEKLKWGKQTVTCVIFGKEELDDPVAAREKFEKLLKTHTLEREIEKLKD
jgi:hypothetical protein